MQTDERTCHYTPVADRDVLFLDRAAAAAVATWCSADCGIRPPTLRWFRPATAREITGLVPGVFAHVPKLAGRADRSSWTIWIRSDLSLREQRLTVAHELRHLSLGPHLAPNFDYESDCELYARRAVDAMSAGLPAGSVAPVESVAPDTARRPSAAPLAAPGRSGSPASYTGRPSPSKAAYVPGRNQPLDPAVLARRYGVPMRSDGTLDLVSYFRQRQREYAASVERF